jgi:hypothetical protein
VQLRGCLTVPAPANANSVFRGPAPAYESLGVQISSALTVPPLFHCSPPPTHFFIRIGMWSESGAAARNFTRVVALVRSQYVFLAIFGLANLKESKLLYDEKMFARGTRSNKILLNASIEL